MTQETSDDVMECPSCHADLRGELIPKKLRKKYYGGKTNYSRLIALYSREWDRVISWKCPDCNHKWTRVYPPVKKKKVKHA